MAGPILQQMIPTAQQVANWEFFGALLGGVFFVLLLAWCLMDHYLGKLQARTEQRDREAAEEAYYRASLEAAAQVGRGPWPPARKAVK